MGRGKIEREIQHCLRYMDHHLLLLKKALERDDVYMAEFQREKLEQIRQLLTEYEYFKMHDKS